MQDIINELVAVLNDNLSISIACFIAILFDTLSGTTKAYIKKEFKSSALREGALKKLMWLIAIGCSELFAYFVGFNGFVMFFGILCITSELYSVYENYKDVQLIKKED